MTNPNEPAQGYPSRRQVLTTTVGISVTMALASAPSAHNDMNGYADDLAFSESDFTADLLGFIKA
jgi:hypothetical protein